jgi:hypothetical protein
MDQPLEIQNLLKACVGYRADEIDIPTLQAAAMFAVSMILDPARNKLRDFIYSAADELESIQFTSREMRQDALRVVESIEQRLKITPPGH